MSKHAVGVDERTSNGSRLVAAHKHAHARLRAAERRWAWEDSQRGYRKPYSPRRRQRPASALDELLLAVLLVLALCLLSTT